MNIYVVIGGILIGLLIGLLIGVTAYKKYKSWRHGRRIKNGIEMKKQNRKTRNAFLVFFIAVFVFIVIGILYIRYTQG